MTALAFLVGWIAALAAGVAVLALRRPAPATAATFDEHAAVASALLQPDLPQLDDTPLADALEDWLRTNTNQES